MSILNKLKKLKLPDDTMLTLKFEEGADVFHYNETDFYHKSSFFQRFQSTFSKKTDFLIV